jgi:hypothetical protein
VLRAGLSPPRRARRGTAAAPRTRVGRGTRRDGQGGARGKGNGGGRRAGDVPRPGRTEAGRAGARVPRCRERAPRRGRAEAGPRRGHRGRARAGSCQAGVARPRRGRAGPRPGRGRSPAPGSCARGGAGCSRAARRLGEESREEREVGAREREIGGGERRCRGQWCWRPGARAARVRVGAAGPPVGPLVGRIELGFCFFSFFSNFEIPIQIIIKFIKNSKLFINKIFIFVLLIIISFTRIFI